MSIQLKKALRNLNAVTAVTIRGRQCIENLLRTPVYEFIYITRTPHNIAIFSSAEKYIKKMKTHFQTLTLIDCGVFAIFCAALYMFKRIYAHNIIC